MQEITMNLSSERSFREVFEEFVISKTAQGVSNVTIVGYLGIRIIIIKKNFLFPNVIFYVRMQLYLIIKDKISQ